jgi:hypothetical protein
VISRQNSINYISKILENAYECGEGLETSENVPVYCKIVDQQKEILRNKMIGYKIKEIKDLTVLLKKAK